MAFSSLLLKELGSSVIEPYQRRKITEELQPADTINSIIAALEWQSFTHDELKTMFNLLLKDMVVGVKNILSSNTLSFTLKIDSQCPYISLFYLVWIKLLVNVSGPSSSASKTMDVLHLSSLEEQRSALMYRILPWLACLKTSGKWSMKEMTSLRASQVMSICRRVGDPKDVEYSSHVAEFLKRKIGNDGYYLLWSYVLPFSFRYETSDDIMDALVEAAVKEGHRESRPDSKLFLKAKEEWDSLKNEF